uniref:hypothetical protein n=1 Tax=Vibrio cholerae TaxID=666 RepID=UPI003B212AE7
VDIEHYQHHIGKNTVAVQDISNFFDKYEKVVGYFGAIAPWLWYDLIKQVVDSHPNVGFLMIGPDYGDCQSLLRNHNDNFLWIGPVSY